MPLCLAVALTRLIWGVNRLFKNKGEVTPDTMYMFARKGGVSIAKAQRMLGYQPKVDLEEGLRRSEAWLREGGQIG
ncbi:hypothetical protein D9M73_169180 [compost metagenome]